MIDEIMQRLGMTSAGKMADEALSSVDWNALHERSQSTFDRVRNGGSLALVDSPMPAQALASARRPKPPSAFDRAYAEMMDTVQHIKNAGGGFGLNVNQPALDAWVADGPLSPNIEDRRKENTVRSKTELRTNLTKQLRFADLGNGDSPNPPPDFPALAALSGMQQAPPVDPAQSAMDRYKQYIPPQHARGPVETIKDAFSLQKDKQGIPQAPGALDYINAALWALPGAKGPRPQAPKPSGSFNALEQIAHDTTQQGTKNLLGLDKPPPTYTHSQYIEKRTGKMSRPEFLESDALWGMARDLAAQKNMSLSGAYSELANPMLVKRYGAAITPEELSKMGLGAAQHGIGPSRHGGWD